MTLLTLAAVFWLAGMASLLRDCWVPRGLTDVRYRTLAVLALASLAIGLYAAQIGDVLSTVGFGLFVVGVILVAHARFMAYRRARLARARLASAETVAKVAALYRAHQTVHTLDLLRHMPRGEGPPPAGMRVVSPEEIDRVEATARAEIEAGKGAMGRMFGA